MGKIKNIFCIIILSLFYTLNAISQCNFNLLYDDCVQYNQTVTLSVDNIADFNFRLIDGEENNVQKITFSEVMLVVNPNHKFGPLQNSINITKSCIN